MRPTLMPSQSSAKMNWHPELKVRRTSLSTRQERLPSLLGMAQWVRLDSEVADAVEATGNTSSKTVKVTLQDLPCLQHPHRYPQATRRAHSCIFHHDQGTPWTHARSILYCSRLPIVQAVLLPSWLRRVTPGTRPVATTRMPLEALLRL